MGLWSKLLDGLRGKQPLEPKPTPEPRIGDSGVQIRPTREEVIEKRLKEKEDGEKPNLEQV